MSCRIHPLFVRTAAARDACSGYAAGVAGADENDYEIIPIQGWWNICWWPMYGRLYGWDATKNALTSEASTLGLLSALMTTTSFSVLLNPVTDPRLNGPFNQDLVLRATTYAAALASIMGIISVALSSFMVMAMGSAPSTHHIRLWIDQYSISSFFNGASFGTSIVAIVAMGCLGLAAKHNQVDAIVCIAAFGVFTLVTAAVCVGMYTLEYGRRIVFEYRAALAAQTGAEGNKPATPRGGKGHQAAGLGGSGSGSGGFGPQRHAGMARAPAAFSVEEDGAEPASPKTE